MPVPCMLTMYAPLLVQDLVAQLIFKDEMRDAETDRIIVDNIIAALEALARSSSAEHRVQRGTLLAGCASPLAEARSREGTERRICERLKVPRGTRSSKLQSRPYAYRQGSLRRGPFNDAVQKMDTPFDASSIGEKVYVGACRSEATLLALHADGGCTVEFRCGEISCAREYASLHGNAKGSARLRRLLPSNYLH